MLMKILKMSFTSFAIAIKFWHNKALCDKLAWFLVFSKASRVWNSRIYTILRDFYDSFTEFEIILADIRLSLGRSSLFRRPNIFQR